MSRLEQHWYRITPFHLILWPISLVFGALAALRRALYWHDILKRIKCPVPVIIIGNISIGGTGKTPLTLHVVQTLLDEGYHPAIISRGYNKTKTQVTPSRKVDATDNPDEVGDEPLLMAQRERCPVWIGRDRPATIQALLQAYPECDVIVSDDGLQHYRLQRDVEIVVVDGQRRFGNGLLLPAGPLREPISRLNEVDAVVINHGETRAGEYRMQLDGSTFYNLLNPHLELSASGFSGQQIHAIAGIGNPQRFFDHLQRLGLAPIVHPFPDHHPYTAVDLDLDDADTILMTEKDAVKCAAFATEKCWVLRVEAQVDPSLIRLIIEKIKP